MANLSDYAEAAVLNALTGRTTFTAPAAVYLGLSTGDFTDTGSGASELTIGSNGYARVAVGFDAAASPGGTTQNTSIIDFPACSTSNWGTITHFGIFDAATSGNLLIHGQFTGSGKTIEVADVLRIAAGDLDLSCA